MKRLEVRRHSLREAGGDQLSPAGVQLARRVGRDMGPFDLVVTSGVQRAFDTASVMGFTVSEQTDLLNPYGPRVDAEFPWPQPFADFAGAVRGAGAAGALARSLADHFAGLMQRIPEGGAALVVCHGGIVEMGVTACLPDGDFSDWGGAVSYCEGARLYWNGRFIRAEELRVMS